MPSISGKLPIYQVEGIYHVTAPIPGLNGTSGLYSFRVTLTLIRDPCGWPASSKIWVRIQMRHQKECERSMPKIANTLVNLKLLEFFSEHKETTVFSGKRSELSFLPLFVCTFIRLHLIAVHGSGCFKMSTEGQFMVLLQIRWAKSTIWGWTRWSWIPSVCPPLICVRMTGFNVQ